MKMRSITEQGALDEFLSTAELAGTDFTAEKMNNVKVIHVDQSNPFLLDANAERAVMRKHQKNKGRLTVPRRPPWDETTTPQQLDVQERESLLEWRRGLAELQENDDLLMTPFERNIEVWRQLWRVIERSDLVVQIVDARNPLLLRSEDLERYVKEVDRRKRNLLLINKADMMTQRQRNLWADYFTAKGIAFKFFSARLAKEQQEEDESDRVPHSNNVHEISSRDGVVLTRSSSDDVDILEKEAQKIQIQDRQDEKAEWSSEEDLEHDIIPSDSPSLHYTPTEISSTRIITVDELESLFLEHAPQLPDPSSSNTTAATMAKTTIGLLGYPNVGKSSTINALIGAKKVSVSATPGKTKHFQTMHLSDQVILCDCPGLVFPNFATTKAELVCDGVLPIDQLREFTGPVGLVAQRIPRTFLEALYGIKIGVRPVEEGGTGTPTASELLRAYAAARGFATTGYGEPDESRAARYILKDYVNGKLLYCHPPPSTQDEAEPVDGSEFNRELYKFSQLPLKSQAWLRHRIPLQHGVDALPEVTGHGIVTSDSTNASKASATTLQRQPERGTRQKLVDDRFFGPGSALAAQMRLPSNMQSLQQHRQQRPQEVQSTGANSRELTGRKQRLMVALEKNIDPSEVRIGGNASKKHFKGKKMQANKIDRKTAQNMDYVG